MPSPGHCGPWVFSTKGEVWEGARDGMVRALTGSGWLPQFNELRLQDGTAAEEESTWARRLSPPPAGTAPTLLTLTTHSVSDDRCKGFYPAGTVSLVEGTG